MPTSIQLGLFSIGSALLLLAILGKGIKLFGAELPSPSTTTERLACAVLGVLLLSGSLYPYVNQKPPGMHFTKESLRQLQEMKWTIHSTGFVIDVAIVVPHTIESRAGTGAKHRLSAVQQFVGEALFKAGFPEDRIYTPNTFNPESVGNTAEVEIVGIRRIAGGDAESVSISLDLQVE